MKDHLRHILSFEPFGNERLRFHTEPGTVPAVPGGGTATPPPPAPSTAAVPPPPAPAPAPTPAAPAAGGSEWDEERAKATIQRQRQEEEAAKAEAKKQKDRADALEREKLTDEEKKEADRKALEATNAQLLQRTREAELLGQLAAREDVADAELARAALLADGIEFDDEGKPKDLGGRVDRLLEAKPVLRKGEAPAPVPPAGGGEGGGGTGNPAAPAATPPIANGGAGSGGQGPPPQLTPEEVEAANKSGMTQEKFAKLRSGASLDEWQAMHKKEGGEGS